MSQNLKNTRKTLRQRLTKIRNYVCETFNTELHSIEQIKVRNTSLEEIWSKFEDVQSQLEILEPDLHIQCREDVEDQYYEMKAKIQEILTNDKSKIEQQSINLHNISNQSDSIQSKIKVNLPQLKIPIFEGKFDQWQSFYDIFVVLIDENETLSDVEKLFYLRSNLKGDALKTIEGVTVSGENYKITLELLKERYDNKQSVINAHIKGLFELPCLIKDSVNSLRNLLSETKQHLRSLETLKLPTMHWDPLIIYMLAEKLDLSTRRAWELNKLDKEAKLLDLYTFLEHRCMSLEAMGINDKFSHKTKQKTTLVATTKQFNKRSCMLCNNNHKLFQCKKFLQLSIQERIQKAKDIKACINCLNIGHIVDQCFSKGCRICQKYHNTLLHLDESKPPQVTQGTSQENMQVTLCNSHNNTQIMLSTAQINIKANDNQWFKCRTLLDNASQANFIVQNLVEHLKLKTYDKNVPINGINQTNANITKAVRLEVASRVSKYKTTLEFLIIDSISCNLPNQYIEMNVFNIPSDYKLADPDFNQPGEIQLLIGGEIFFEILGYGNRQLGKNLPFIQSSAFGWIVSGKINHNSITKIPQTTLLTTNQLNDSLMKFWTIEATVNIKSPMSIEERDCEEIFERTTKRNSDGRYIVKLPLKQEAIPLGDSYIDAKKRFDQLERRFERNSELHLEYIRFMNDYLKLNHMQEVINTNQNQETINYIPHHPVFKDAKIRVVFDASMKTKSGISLNDNLLVGPTVHQDLFSIVIRFRKHMIAFSADIKKMYRQILIDENQIDLQRILWRENKLHELKSYQLKTVTYGTSSAPYLATKCIQQLTKDEEMNYPLASVRIRNDTYVDDIMTGASDLTNALELQEQIISMLKSGCFELHKWCSNAPEILANITNQEKQLPIIFGKTEVKTLGLLWSPTEDTLRFVVNPKNHIYITKRSVLSDIASVFDPLGLIGPFVVKAKLIMQDLWKSKAGWDDPLESDIFNEWIQWRNQLDNIKELQIPRKLIGITNPTRFDLLGFSDASEVAYGAAVYLRSENSNGECSVRLITSKSRVAPIKEVTTVTLARLELCGALILSRLIERVVSSLELHFENVYLWTDSQIVLAWLNGNPSRWKTFVANRVAEIQDITNNYSWNHIKSEENPADCLSRGSTLDELKTNTLWWQGPDWIHLPQNYWTCSQPVFNEKQLKEIRTSPITSLVTMQHWEHIHKYSTFKKLQRVTAYCIRFISNCKKRNNNSFVDCLSVMELDQATTCLIKRAQREVFFEEIQNITKGIELPSNSKLKSLTPFLDENNVLRIGGRITKALIPFDQKYPVILPQKHQLTKLLLEQEHLRLLHAGTQAVLTNIRRKFWPINAKSEIRRIIHNCVKCFRFRTKGSQQLMANLPKERVQPARPFLNVGIDYGGPIYVKTGNRRNSPIQKTYIALFICLCTRAIHLELVTSLSTESFLNALTRFTSRRGKCKQIFSDNATNFKGANSELHELYNFFQQQETRQHIREDSVNKGIDWKFIPPNSPHFGGIWEAGIKSTKFHLKRTMGTSHFTFEETYTLLIEIEACLNSRPLIPCNNDPTDFTILTPAHFLIGDLLTSTPIPTYTELPLNTLSRWQLIQRLQQQFWKKWSLDYLNHLQQRHKWQKIQPNLQKNMVVLVKEDNLPPLNWSIARIKEVHPGADGNIRVATIVNARGGEFKRPITKLCPLPLQEEEEDILKSV